MKTLRSLIGAALIAGSSIALAAEPALLEETDLDGVTAGLSLGVADATAAADAIAAGIVAFSATGTHAEGTATVVDLGGPFQLLFVGSSSSSGSVAENFQ